MSALDIKQSLLSVIKLGHELCDKDDLKENDPGYLIIISLVLEKFPL